MSNNDAVAPRGLSNGFQTFFTIRVNTTNRPRVRSISCAAGATPSRRSSRSVRLTLQKPQSKSNDKVSGSSSNLYAESCAQTPATMALQDSGEPAPSERLLEQMWRHQRLQRDSLKTLDGHWVRVLHPGFWNHEAGPDFRQAILQFGHGSSRSGDVEIDLHPAGWRGHAHDRNPAYQNVILHVVWDAESKVVCPVPTLTLKSRLDAPLSELSLLLGPDAGAPRLLAGQCSAPLRGLPESTLRELLEQAALIRLQRKGREFGARARQVGWEQSLWEGLFAALGYKHNVWPMQRLAELVPLLRANESQSRITPLVLQARLLGLSGLLPVDLTRARAGADNYLRRVWDHWWREREEFAVFILPRAIWRFHGLRPANHPQRRLALASRWSAKDSLAAKLEAWCLRQIPNNALAASLLETLQVEADEFWSWHCTFRSARFKKPQPLLGGTRATANLAVALKPQGSNQPDADAINRQRWRRRDIRWRACSQLLAGGVEHDL